MIYLNILGNLSKAGLKISHLGKPSKIEKSFTSSQVCEPCDNNTEILCVGFSLLRFLYMWVILLREMDHWVSPAFPLQSTQQK